MQRTSKANEHQEDLTVSSKDMLTAVRELVTLMRESGMAELDIETQALSVRLRAAQQAPTLREPVTVVETETTTTQMTDKPGHVVTSPMIGTYYAAPAPGESPFVQIGDEVEVGQVVGIVEAMKIMNEIIADRPGVVSEVMVENAQPVEYGSPLVRLMNQADMNP